MAYKMDFFGGTYEKVLEAIKNKKVQYPAYVLIRSEEDESTIQIGFVDKGNVLKLATGSDKKQILSLPQLPSVEDGNIGILYIIGDVAYIFNGTKYIPLNQANSEEIAELKDKMASLEENMNAMTEQVTTLDTKIETLTETIESTASFVELE